jgi:hypothetical protein
MTNRVVRSISIPLTVLVCGLLAVSLFAGPALASESEQPETADFVGVDQAAEIEPAEGDLEPCVASETVMCLHRDRYEVTIEWEDPQGARGQAKVVRGGTRTIGTNESGTFYFFSPSNWEVLLKVLDACQHNQHHWVYAASASDVGMTLVVRDTSLPNYDADRRMIVNSRTYTFAPLSRRPQNPGESNDDYRMNVLARGHPALTESGAFPDACPAVADA